MNVSFLNFSLLISSDLGSWRHLPSPLRASSLAVLSWVVVGLTVKHVTCCHLSDVLLTYFWRKEKVQFRISWQQFRLLGPLPPPILSASYLLSSAMLAFFWDLSILFCELGSWHSCPSEEGGGMAPRTLKRGLVPYCKVTFCQVLTSWRTAPPSSIK